MKRTLAFIAMAIIILSGLVGLTACTDKNENLDDRLDDAFKNFTETTTKQTTTPAPSYTPNTIGNTPGNIANRGLVAIQGDWIYYGNHGLTRTKTDGIFLIVKLLMQDKTAIDLIMQKIIPKIKRKSYIGNVPDSDLYIYIFEHVCKDIVNFKIY